LRAFKRYQLTGNALGLAKELQEEKARITARLLKLTKAQVYLANENKPDLATQLATKEQEIADSRANFLPPCGDLSAPECKFGACPASAPICSGGAACGCSAP
jgi:hypothetical protein